MIPTRLIEKKRRGQELDREELESFFLGFLRGEIPDYQMAAFLMAVHFNGLSRPELESLLDLMIHSGDVLDLGAIPEPKVDKHSTGGVGDKTSLVLAPLAAELGLCVPMMSGRGLGHTAGTLDKLEAIPGFRTQLTLGEFRSILDRIGVAMIGQTEEIAPLDRRLYALRDATSTVPSVPLIAASIMSKKLAEGLDGLVLDVKTGEGAFLPNLEDSLELARTMVTLGEERAVRTTALVTDMGAPLGTAVGNGLETREAFRCLAGDGPEDLAEISATLVGEMLFLGDLAGTPEEGFQRAQEALASGRGMGRMESLVELQGGDPSVVENPSEIPGAPEVAVLEAGSSGFVGVISPTALGYGVVELGGGRLRMGDPVDLRVGFNLRVGLGDRVEPGDPVGEVHARDSVGIKRGLEILEQAVDLQEEAPLVPPSLVRHRLDVSE
ncbi:MAG: thymidine phosphorylase [Gemmatimonadetes bacterium]|nr:thymidine phosphorylase [Gemmatimonadota bacterium]NNM07075.1 thymidine phosphorylase [Gemmatimonadota bacterium]